MSVDAPNHNQTSALVFRPAEFRDTYLKIKRQQEEKTAKRSRLRRNIHRLTTLPILEIFTILAGLGGMVFLCVYVGIHAGLLPTIVGGITAIIPLLVVLAILYQLMRWDREPGWLIALCFLWGAGVATSMALLGNQSGMSLFSRVDLGPSPLQVDGVTATIVAPIVEESLKGLGVALFLLFRRKYVNAPLSGVVFGGVVAAGFAYTENILYFARSIELLPIIFVMRAVMSPFAHIMFTSATGVAIAIALTRISRRKYQIMVGITGLFTAMVLHATWNGLASYNPGYFFIGYLLFWGPFFTIWITTALVLASKQRKWVIIGLGKYREAGWISDSEHQMLCSLQTRWMAALRAKQFGRKARRNMLEFQKSASALALNYVSSVHIGLVPVLQRANMELLVTLLEARVGYMRACGTNVPAGETGALEFLREMLTAQNSAPRPVLVGNVNEMPGWASEAPGFFRRDAARVVLLDQAGNVLLLRGHDQHDRNYSWWFTIGGGIEEGESGLQAAVRELAEETGLQIDPSRFVGPVLKRRGLFEFTDKTCVQDEQFFVLRISPNEVAAINNRGWSASENQLLDEMRWFRIVDLGLLAHHELVYPAVLPSLVQQWNRGWNGRCLVVDETQ